MPIIIDYSAEVRPIPVATLVHRAGLLLQDEEHIRWTVKEMIEWINEGVGALIRMKPAAGARRAVLGLSPGARQRVDGSDIQLIDVVCNIGGDDVTPGRAVRRVERYQLDSADPNWQAMPRSTTIRHYAYDDRMPTVFYVYPPAAVGAKVEILRAVLPEDVNAIGDNVGLSIEYADAMLNYLMFRCVSKDSEYAQAAMATGYYQAFVSSMSAGDAGEQVASPNAKVPA